MTLPNGVRAAAIGLLCAVAVAASSCGAKRETAEVTGKVTYNGQPVTAGNVYFVSADDPTFTGGGPLGPDGTFKCPAPVGKVKLAVQTTAFKPRPKESGAGSGPSGGGPSGGKSGPPAWAKGGKKESGGGVPSPDILSKTGAGDPDAPRVGSKYTPIPDKYENADSSTLTFDVVKGSTDLGEVKLTGEVKK